MTTTTAPRPTTHPTTPTRPRLLAGLAVLRRIPGEIQIGTNPRTAVVISGVPDPLFPLLHALDGRNTTDELMARAGPRTSPQLLEIITGLTGMGLVEDAGRPATAFPARLAADRTAWTLRAGPAPVEVTTVREQSVVVVHGSGRVGIAVATLLAAAGVGWVHPVVDGAVQPEDTGSGYLDADVGQSRSSAALRAVHRAASGVRTDRLPVTRRPDLVVLADQLVPDPQLAASLLADGVPHLPARATEGTGLVGPLVVPSRTSCLRCADLHATEVDYCWPTVATQLAVSNRPADLATSQATAAFTVGQVLRLLHEPSEGRADLPVWNTTIEIDTFAGTSRSTPAGPHPTCSCGAGTRAPRPASPTTPGRG
jgi:bacteriocin biosynthesis cyclodehydratase domain-containing protein